MYNSQTLRRFFDRKPKKSPRRIFSFYNALQWRHNGRDGVSNHQPHDCLFNRYSGADRRKHQSSASLAFVRGIHRGPVNSPHKGPVTQKMFPFDDVIIEWDFMESRQICTTHKYIFMIWLFEISLRWDSFKPLPNKSMFEINLFRWVSNTCTCLVVYNKISLSHIYDVIMSAMASQITSLTIVYSRCRSKKTSKLRVTGLCEGNSLVTGEFPARRASSAENVYLITSSWHCQINQTFVSPCTQPFNGQRPLYHGALSRWKVILPVTYL